MKLRYYLVRRVAGVIPVLIGLSLLTFIISHAIPGDPARLAAGQDATPEMVEAIRRDFGLDQPLHLQYLRYLQGLLRGDLGRSLLSRRPVARDLLIYFPATLELALVAGLIAILAGIPLGIFAASSQGSWPDQLERIFSLSIVSLPVFWIALMAQLALGYALGLVPTGGRFDILASPPPTVTRLYLVDSLLAGDLHAFGVTLQHLALPAVCLSLGSLSSITRMTRAAVLDVLHKDYVRLERANGIPEIIILFKYVLKSAFTSILTIIGLSFGWMLAGSVLVETVFDWPGIGLYTTKSIMYLDFLPIMGVTLLSGVAFFTVNLIVDILYGAIDPRVRRG